jgi:parallel beta helix pectate lyase-like protein
MARRLVRLASVLVFLFLSGISPVLAAQRSFVSAGSGSDANPCSRTEPCRNFAAAIAATDANGEVVALDSGGYGTVTIPGPISIVAPPGVYAGITAFSGYAISINSGTASAVILRGLTLNGLGGTDGIYASSVGKLYVQNCVLSNFSASGLAVSAAADVFVADTSARLNGESGFFFVGSRANLERISAEGNKHGVTASADSNVTVTRSTAAGNSQVGLYSSSSTSGVINVESCTTTHNGWGVYAYGTARVSNTMITNNATGVANGPGASTISFGNNLLDGNTADGLFLYLVPPE